MLANLPRSWSYSRACRLWTGTPVAPPRVPRATRWRKAEALTSIFWRSAIERIGLCRNRNQQSRKRRRRHGGKRELTHCRPPSACEKCGKLVSVTKSIPWERPCAVSRLTSIISMLFQPRWPSAASGLWAWLRMARAPAPGKSGNQERSRKHRGFVDWGPPRLICALQQVGGYLGYSRVQPTWSEAAFDPEPPIVRLRQKPSCKDIARSPKHLC